jgi:hypothetical protein
LTSPTSPRLQKEGVSFSALRDRQDGSVEQEIALLSSYYCDKS